MNTPARLALASLFTVASVAGVFFAYSLGHRHGALHVLNSAGFAPADVQHEITRLRGEVRLLRVENEKLTLASSHSASAAATRPPARDTASAPLSALVRIQRQYHLSFELPLIDANARLTPGCVEVFRLTPDEKRILQETLTQARERIDELARAHARATWDRGALVMTMQPFAGGAEIRAELMQAFARTLGPERHASFTALASKQLSRVMLGFGTGPWTITCGQKASNRPGNFHGRTPAVPVST